MQEEADEEGKVPHARQEKQPGTMMSNRISTILRQQEDIS